MPLTLAQQLTELWFASQGNFANIRSFRKCAQAGMYTTAAQSYKEAFVLPKALDKDGWFFPDREQALSDEFGHTLGSLRATQTLATNEAATNAACIVFAHSIVDDVATRCCKLIALADPNSWKTTLEKKQVSLVDVASAGYDNLYAAKLNDYLENEVARKSLIDRTDIINAKCQPLPEHKRFDKPFTFNRDRLLKLDELRHEIVHDVAMMKVIPNIEDDVNFMDSTSDYLIWAINHKYHVYLDFEWWLSTRQKTQPV